MVLLYYIPIFFCLVSCVSADNWDDFANNLATDLAPLITLFGEQITRQCMSELIGTLDDFIFALAPLGVLTAVVSAIRVCGNSTLRAIIGRAQEDPASSEKELLSCVSSSTGEIFTESGIARITGNPKILEIVVDKSQAQSGVVTVRTVSEVAGKSWADLEKDVKSPNLSLNKGIRRRAPFWFHLAATFGVILQLCIILYAALTVMYKPQSFLKDGSPVDSYAFPMYVLGTVLLTLGMFLCAVLVERHSLKQDITLPKGNRAYWIQPGNQTVGDQKFPSFVGRTDEDVYFIRSVRDDSPNSLLNLGGEMELMLVVGLTMIGFVIQFVGIRGLHSSVILAQLGATMVMTLVRTGLRAGRMQEGDNMLKGNEQTIVSEGEHELDWLIFHLFKIKSFKICPSYRVHGPSPQSQVDPIIREPVLTRKRLRKLAGSVWDETPVRKMAQNLGQATHDLMRVIGSWCDREVPYFDIDIPLGIQKEGAQQLLSHTWQTRLTAGKEVDVDFLEAILGLYVWSLKKANHGLVEKSRTDFFRTFKPRKFTSHQAQLLYQAWANDIPSFIDTQSASRYYLSECWTFGHLDMMTNNKVQNDTALIAISSDVYTMAAQDIYMQILHSALEPLSAIGGKTQIKGSDKSSYRLSNEHVELLASGFSMAGLGDFNQSLASILPVLADRSLISGVSSGLPDVRQSMEGFATNEDFGGLIEMSEWLCSLADHGEVQRSIVEYAHLCLNILLKPDIVVQELAVERIAAMLDVTDGGRSHSISKYLNISSSPTEEWLNRFRAEIAWMVSQIIHSLKIQSWDKRMLKLLQKLETKFGEHAFTLPETYHNLEAAASSQRTFFALWLGSNIGFSDSSNHSSQDALDWLMNNQFTILLELLVIKMVNDFSLTYHLLEMTIYAAQKNYREAIYFLLHHTERTKRRHDIIGRLSRQGDIETLQAFLGKGGSFGTITEDHELSFLIAAEEKHYPLLKFLLEGGVNVDLRDSNGETALMKAASNGDIDSAELLISFNASLDQQKDSGDTALICAVDNGHLHLLELLISKGADVNLTGYRGKTALMSAALGRDMQILKYLCEHNADVDIRNLDKDNVLDVAEKGGFEPWVEGCAYLEELGAKRSTGVQNPD